MFEQYIKIFMHLSPSRQHIRMISEGSCDTEDWSNDAENSALIITNNYSLTDITTESSCFKLHFFHTITILTIFNNKCSCGGQKRLLSTFDQ